MNLFALLYLCASAASVSLGASVYFINKKSAVNRLFLFLMLANAYWAFCDFMMSQTSSLETAQLWSKVLTFWPLVPVLLLHFTLAFTESDLLKNRLSYVVLYAPALVFSLIDLTTNWISVVPTMHPWGYATTYPAASIGTRSDGLWAGILALFTLFLFINYYNRITDKTRKQQTKFVAIGLGIPIFISIVTDSIFVVAGIDFPVLGSISGTLTSLLVVYAMLRYELFGFRPEIAAENVFSTMADAFILADLRGVIVKVNRAVLQVSGCTEDEILGKTVSNVVQEAGVLGSEKRFSQFMAELRRVRELRGLEITFHSKDGEKKVGSLSCSMVCDSRGQDVGVAFVVHDVTEQKEMEQKLLKTERLASIGELAGILGHDLRNPLNAIRTGAYYLKNKNAATLDDKDALIFDSIEESIDYSDKIVTDLIEYASEISLQPREATAKSLVTAALTLATPPPKVEVVDGTEETQVLRVDPARIHRAFANIITNAYDAMPNGGTLTLKSSSAGNKVVFTFEDTGVGMSKDTLSRISTPLFTTKAKGMGFGLSISRRIVEAHGGKISAESQPNAGTTLTVELPLKAETKKFYG